ncbi:CHASE3 domain-containing protein, partial [Desulfobulbus sp. TB]|nr:CHASE3 domain-containing protein [Desulfobulbus sp. TB]
MSLRVKLALFISLLFITTIGNALFTFQLEKYEEEKLQWVNHTNEVIIETKNLLSAMQDAETGQRGFLLTKDTAYLKPYHTGVINAKKRCATLRRLTPDNKVQQERLEAIEESMQLKFDELEKTIQLTQSNQYTEALELVNQDIGKRYMDEIRRIVADFVMSEKILLERRKGDFREHKAMIKTLVIVEIVFFIFLALVTISFLQRNLFASLRLLLTNTEKMERGEKIDATDMLPRDEMGYLLSAFFKMNE